MKKMGLVGLIGLLCSWAVSTSYENLDSGNGCTLQGFASIDANGCEYGARIVNSSNSYVKIEKSKVKARFRYSKYYSSSGKTKTKAQNKSVKFPRLFMAPNTTASRDRERSDSDDKTYLKVLGISGELGVSQLGSDAEISDAVLVPEFGESVVFEDDRLRISAEMKENVLSGPVGFSKRPVKFTVLNKTSERLAPGKISLRIFYQGIYHDITKSIRFIQAGKDKSFKDDFDNMHFNFVPKIYVRTLEVGA